jgi:hypothetical protein
MSDGHSCFLRDLAPPIGGKGVSRRDAIIDFNQRGRVNVFGVLSAGLRGHEQSSVNVRLSVRDPS